MIYFRTNLNKSLEVKEKLLSLNADVAGWGLESDYLIYSLNVKSLKLDCHFPSQVNGEILSVEEFLEL